MGSTLGHFHIGLHWLELLIVQPSSAAAERAFSFLNTLSAQQEGALKDYSSSLLVDPDCESVITLLIVIVRKQKLARLQTRLLHLLFNIL